MGWCELKKAVFLDRDGVVNKAAPKGEYILTKESFKFLLGIAKLVRYFNDRGLAVIVVTNQQCVGKGLITKRELNLLHWWAIAILSAQFARIDKIFYCPHLVEDDCDCRKPKPGMLFLAEYLCDIDLKNSWMIGDSATDIEAGQVAGCKTILLVDGERNRDELDSCEPEFVVNSLDEIKSIIK